MVQATKFRKCAPEEVYRVTHEACEATKNYKGKTTLESALAGLRKYDCYAIEEPLMGAIIFCGNEGHIAVLPEYRKSWAGRAFYRFMQEQVKQRGVIRVVCGNPEALKFIEQLEQRGYVCLVGKNY